MSCLNVRKVILFGGSAGGLQPLCEILGKLQPDLPAAIMAVIHTSEESKQLPEVVQHCSEFEVIAPTRAEPIHEGRIYLPAPGRHLVVNSNCVMSWMGPRENRHRPAVDTLFRTAARAYRSHVIAVVLSGALDDGTAGALAVKSRGGTVVVQDPTDAKVSAMPANVLRQVGSDHCVSSAAMPELLARLICESRPMKLPRRSVKECERLTRDPQAGQMEPIGYSCPECGGALLEIKDGKTSQFRCHVGHTFSLESFSAAHADALERALWVALRRLNEQRSIHESLAKGHAHEPRLKKRYRENAAAAEHDMQLLHEILARL